MGYSVFLVEDNLELGELLKSYLEREGFAVRYFSLGLPAEAAIVEHPQLWVLDIMLPDTDGFEIIKKIKAETPEVPVIFISARDQTLDRVLGLEMGSDDYIAKPFLPRELVIRAKKLLERTYGAQQGVTGKVYLFDGYRIDEDRRSVADGETEIPLTSKEADLVLAFAANAGRPFSRDALLNLVWDDNYFGSDRVVDDLIRRVRKKMPRLRIETVYGQGYRLMV
ncbi:MAG: response regulator transcription factor [Clostridia bacterium]|nr:response regulator transcription factor [Clostridia bacterium]MDR3644412.1 response regulator transcription factor [Clostridia bacterium]